MGGGEGGGDDFSASGRIKNLSQFEYFKTSLTVIFKIYTICRESKCNIFSVILFCVIYFSF